MKKLLLEGRTRRLPSLIAATLLLVFFAVLLEVPGRALAGYLEKTEVADAARTAAWSTVMSPVIPASTSLRADGTSVSQEIVFTLAADTESACMYTIRFTGVPEGIGISLDGSPYTAGSGGTVSFENAAWQLAAGETEAREHSARFKCLAPMDGGTDEIIAEALFTQID
ncbi:MAG: hypothetical protein IJL78_10310 [Lachnospiraceae bacterium]|nr:hypothetical protein [Lachnospiraceae bacterium]